MTTKALRYDAVVLAGGDGRRLGCVDKAMLEVGGRTLLERVLSAVAAAERVVCVGPVRETTRAVTWCRESPPGGGPVAALAAGFDALAADTVVARPAIVVVLAVDLPFVDAETVQSLVMAVEGVDGRAAVGGADGAVAVDASGRVQPLLAAYRRAPLGAQLSSIGPPAGARVRDLVGRLRLREVQVATAEDCDTVEELEAARARLAP